MNEEVAIWSRAMLTRNYPDLPFATADRPADAGRVISRTVAALEDNDFALQLLQSMAENDRQVLMEAGQANAALLKAAQTSAVLLPVDGTASMMLAGRDHLTIVSRQPGLALPLAAEDCFHVEDQLSGRVEFAFDDALGYLTSQPAQLGTGLHLSVRLHVPMIIRARQEGSIASILRPQGMRLYAVAMDGDKPEGDMLEIANIGALGRTEQELCQLLTDAVGKICQTENELRQREREEHAATLEDRVFRAQGILRSARLMTEAEFWRLWSDLRLGAAMELLPMQLWQVDALMNEAKPAHLRSYAEEDLNGEALDACRAARVREMLEEHENLL